MVILAALFCLFFAFFLRPINWMTVNGRAIALLGALFCCIPWLNPVSVVSGDLLVYPCARDRQGVIE